MKLQLALVTLALPRKHATRIAGEGPETLTSDVTKSNERAQQHQEAKDHGVI